jgi:hypothetical protein
MTIELHDGTHVRVLIRRKYFRAFGPVCLCALLASGCFRAQAKTMPDVPLEMPAPPERVVEVNDPETPPIISLPEEPVRNTPPRPRPAPPPRADVRPPDAARPDTATDGSKPAEDAARTPATLQTAPTEQEGELERRIRALLTQATTDLNRINVQALNTDARTQFDTAKRFVNQAEDALRTKNLVFASNLADKASVLAAQLAGR